VGMTTVARNMVVPVIVRRQAPLTVTLQAIPARPNYNY